METQPLGLEALAKHIDRQLKERGFCVVFEDELARCWPIEEIKPAERAVKIRSFAETHRWRLFMSNCDSVYTLYLSVDERFEEVARYTNKTDYAFALNATTFDLTRQR